MSEPFTILIDGKCALCRREARFMQGLDAGQGKLRILDITAPDFDPAMFRTGMAELMGQIHGVTPDGRLITGMQVFRETYRALAFGGSLRSKFVSAAMNITGWPLVCPVADAFYRWFARNRLKISAQAAKVLGDEPQIVCEGDRCKMP